jgi:hypothetical protein
MVELDIVLLYIWSCVWGIIYVVGPGVVTVQTPRRHFSYDVRQWKVLGIAINEVSGAWSMHAVPLAIRIIYGTHNSDSPVRTLSSTT